MRSLARRCGIEKSPCGELEFSVGELGIFVRSFGSLLGSLGSLLALESGWGASPPRLRSFESLWRHFGFRSWSPGPSPASLEFSAEEHQLSFAERRSIHGSFEILLRSFGLSFVEFQLSREELVCAAEARNWGLSRLRRKCTPFIGGIMAPPRALGPAACLAKIR